MKEDAKRSPEVDATKRTDLRWALALFLLALLPRVLHLLTVRDSPFFSMLILDPLMYDEWGLALARGESGGGVFFQDPLYAYFLAGVYELFGHHYGPVVVMQSLLGALVSPLVFVAARPWFERPAAVAAGVIAAVYVPAVYYDGLVLKTSLGVFWVAVLLVMLSRAARRGSRLWWGLAGLVLGLGALTRGNLVLLLPVIVLWILLDSWTGRGRADSLSVRLSDRRRWSAVAAVVLGCAAILLPVAVRNRVVGAEWVLTTANAGQNFYIGNNPLNLTGEYQRLPFVDPNPKYEQRDFAREAERREGRRLGARETSSFWFGQAAAWIRANPGDWARLVWLKLRVYWAAYEVPDNLDYYLYREAAPVLRLPVPGFGLVAPLGLLGALLVWRRRGWPRLLVLLVLCYSLSVVLFFVFSRFRMAMMPAIFVLAGHAAVESWRIVSSAFRGRDQRSRAVVLAAALVLFFAFVNLPLRSHDGGWTARIAGAVGFPVRIETSATARFNLGVAYAERAKTAGDAERWLGLAEQQLRLAWGEERRYASIPVELGKVLARQGRNLEAIGVYEQALVLEPDNYRLHHALGLLYTRLEDLDPAADAFRHALQLEPRHTASATRLGEALLGLDLPADAAGAFRHALALSPGDSRAQRGLSRAEARINAP